MFMFVVKLVEKWVLSENRIANYGPTSTRVEFDGLGSVFGRRLMVGGRRRSGN